MTKLEAIKYLRSSGFSIEQIQDIKKAFEEPDYFTLGELWNATKCRIFNEHTGDYINFNEMQDNKNCIIKKIKIYFDPFNFVHAIAVILGEEKRKWERENILEVEKYTQKKGKWYRVNNGDYERPDYAMECSECGEQQEDYWESAYCPECGAKMEVEE